ncbi:MAG TPA: COX15/CtaA family protein [Gaiellaceae bacterium]|nr:COX15/CtaA family protein [Gaiellaceae bacterium]
MEAGARTARLRSLTISPATFEWLAWAALAMLWLIVLSGATVRLTGSGLGCENWPRCGETLLPPKDYNAYVEFGNRVMGFAVGLTTLVTAAGALLVRGLPRWLRFSALALPVSVLAQGVLGGITVLLELHPLIVMAHYLLSLVALAIAVVVVQGARDLARGAVADEAPLGSAWLALALVPLALALVVSGALVTAAGPHSGGEEIPRVGDLVEMVHIHIGSTALFGIGFLALLALLVVERRRARVELLLAGVVLALLLLQMAVGEIQWREGLPWGLVLAHVMIATTVWVLVFALATRIVVRRRARLQA